MQYDNYLSSLTEKYEELFPACLKIFKTADLLIRQLFATLLCNSSLDIQESRQILHIF